MNFSWYTNVNKMPDEIPSVPFPNSYWVIPGKFIAGEYPGDTWEEKTRHKVDGLLQCGVDMIIDLTQPGENIPYLPILQEEAGYYGKQVTHQRRAIPDWQTPLRAELSAILDTIDKALAEGHTVYVHCYGGIGRTGTIVGCFLARHGQPGQQALKTLRSLRQETPAGHFRSPETDAQVQLVLDWDDSQSSEHIP